jgi:hypothetical protein
MTDAFFRHFFDAALPLLKEHDTFCFLKNIAGHRDH